jgi:hypothetical protein
MFRAVTAVAGFVGSPLSLKAAPTWGRRTVFRSGTISASIATCARCSAIERDSLRRHIWGRVLVLERGSHNERT